ncbi:MAG: hypothetical protein RLY31_3030 [Bacteroidota bacterium]
MEQMKYRTVEEYLADQPVELAARLECLRQTIRTAIPEAREVISYNMPAYRTRRVLVYFAACRHHIGFYPTPSAMVAFRDRLAGFPTSKGAVRFPHHQPLPASLVAEICRFRYEEEEAR